MRCNEYQRNAWYDSMRQPAARSRATGRPRSVRLPIASTTIVTFTPLRARSLSASMNRDAIAPSWKM